jgi:hypothetical protein
MMQHLLALDALVERHEDDSPEMADQYCVVDLDGSRHVYGDQNWVKYGEALKHHPDGRIEHRVITISYGEWGPMTDPGDALGEYLRAHASRWTSEEISAYDLNQLARLALVGATELGLLLPPGGAEQVEYGRLIQASFDGPTMILSLGFHSTPPARNVTHTRVVTSWPSCGVNNDWPRYQGPWTPVSTEEERP